MNAPVDIDQGIHKVKLKVALNEKRKKLRGFPFSINMANFDAFCWTKKLISNLFFLKSASRFGKDIYFCLFFLLHFLKKFLRGEEGKWTNKGLSPRWTSVTWSIKSTYNNSYHMLNWVWKEVGAVLRGSRDWGDKFYFFEIKELMIVRETSCPSP